MARRSVNRYFEGLLAGGVLGIAIGLLSARKPGNQFRQDIRELLQDLSTTVVDTYKDLQCAWHERGGAATPDMVARGKALVDNFMGNNSGPVYTAPSQKTAQH